MACAKCGQPGNKHLDTCPNAKKQRGDSRQVTVTKVVPPDSEKETVSAMADEGYFLQQRRDDGNRVVLTFMLSA